MDLHPFLTDTPYACSDLTPLSGGVANFTCRGQLVTPLADGTKTVVIKHAEPYVALNKSFKLDVARSVCVHQLAVPETLFCFLESSESVGDL